MSTRFYVGGLSPNISKDDLQALFNRLAPVEEVHVPSAIMPALSRPFMIVKLKSEADGKAIAAVTKLNGSMWKGSKLRIEPAKPFFKERLENEKRIEAEKEALAAASTKPVIPKYNKKAPAVLSTLLPEKELASLPPRPAFLRIRRARCVPAYRISEPVLCLHEQTFKKKAVKVDDRMKFAKHIIFDDDKVQQLMPEVEPFTIVTNPAAPVKKDPAEKLSKNKKKEKAKEAKAVEAGKAAGGDDGIEIVKKPVIGGGQRKGFGTLLAAATAAANDNKSSGKTGPSSGGRLSQMAENEMDLDDDLDDDDMVRRFPMPQTHIEYAHADLSTGKTKILTEEESAAERQRMLAVAMMTLAAPPVVPPPPKRADQKKASAAATASHPTDAESSKETITGRKRSLSNASDSSEGKQALKSAMSPAEKSTAATAAATATTEEKRVKFKAALEEVREIPSRHDLKPSFVPSRLDDAVRNIFGAPKPTPTPTPAPTSDATPSTAVSSSSSSAAPAEVPENHIMPSGYADMSTLKSIFDSGEQGGIWWDDNVGKVVERAAEERGKGFQNDEIFRAAEKYGIDVRMFDFSTPSQEESTSSAPHLSMTSGSGSTSMAAESTSMVFDFFGDGASVAPSSSATSAAVAPVASSSPLAAVASSSSSVVTASTAPAGTPIYLHDQLLDVLVPLARQFHRDRSEEDMLRDWERNKQRIFAIVTKKAKVVKKQAKASAKSSFRRGGAGGGGGGGGHHAKKDGAAGGGYKKKAAAHKK